MPPPPPPFSTPKLPTSASTDLSPKNNDNVYCEVYNYLTPYLLGKAAILIHCPLQNRRLLSFLSKTLDALGRPLYTARLSRIPQLLDSNGPPTKGFRQGHHSARLQASHAQRIKVIGTGQQNYFNPATNDALERFVEEKSKPYGVIDQLSSNFLKLFCLQRKLQINKILLKVAFPWYFDITDSLFLLCLHNNLMYIMPYHCNIK